MKENEVKKCCDTCGMNSGTHCMYSYEELHDTEDHVCEEYELSFAVDQELED